MAEPDADARDRVLGTFLTAYNAAHSSEFRFETEEPSQDLACDYLCRDGRSGQALKIQHTRAATEEQAERALPAMREAIANELRAQLDRVGLTGVGFDLTIDRPPRKRADRRKLVGKLWLAAYTAAKDFRSRPGLVLRFSRQLQDALREVEEHVEHFSVYEGGPGIMFSSITAGKIPLTSGQRVRESLERKAASGDKDLVLLIHFDTWPFESDYDLPELQAIAAELAPRYSEVWIVNDFAVPEAIAHRIWP